MLDRVRRRAWGLSGRQIAWDLEIGEQTARPTSEESMVMTDQAVRVERSGPVSTVFLHRPARRNAVDGPAAALASEFAHGQQALATEAGSGAARFSAGAGRHGSFGA